MSAVAKTTLDAAAKFLQSVVIIDDEAYATFVRGADARVNRVEEPGLAQGDKEAQLESVVSMQESASPEEISHGLETRKLVEAFARNGLICAALEPANEPSDDLMAQAAYRADVIVLDWVFKGDGGVFALAFLNKVLAQDQGQRLRLVLVYTAEPDVGSILKKISEATGLGADDSSNVVTDEIVRVAVFNKPETVSAVDGLKTRAEDLPARAISEFAHLAKGLIPTATIKGIGAIRQNTHKMLARLHRRLDEAFLIHRMLLPYPVDATEFVVDLIGQEIAALLHSCEVGDTVDLDAITEWFEGRQLTKSAIELGLGEADILSLLTLGCKDHLKKTPLKVDAQSKKTDKQRLLKKGALLLTDPAEERDLEFAHVTSMIHRYDTEWLPTLTLGSVVSISDKYYVCVQPICDCVRIGSSDRRRFAFVQASSSRSSPNMVIRYKDQAKQPATLTSLKAEPKARSIVQFEFAASPGLQVVRATKSDDSCLFFKTADNEIVTWHGQLKFPQAQRFAQLLSSHLARVGLDESEWLRLSGEDADE